MSIPLAVSPSQLTPGLYLTVDLLAGQSSPGTGELRVALLASKSAAGDMTNDTEVRAGAGATSAAVAFGNGTPGHLAAKLLYAKFPAAQVDYIAPAPGATVATLDVTAAGAPSADNVVDCDYMGRTFEVTWLVGESPDDIKDKLITAINERDGDLFVTAVSGGVGVLTNNAKIAGNIGEDVLLQLTLREGQTGSETLVGAATPTPLAGGTTDPDFTAALSAIEGQEYPFILPALSNADAANVATTSNAKRCIDHIKAHNEGLDAKLQQLIVGFTGTIPQGTAATPDSDSFQNAVEGNLTLCVSGRGLPAELGGREVGGMLRAYTADPAANRIGETLDGYIGAKDKIADKPTLAESEDALGNGVSLVTYTPAGQEQLVRSITTHSQDDAGAPDRRLLDLQNVTATYIVVRDIRNVLPIEFKGAKITADTPAGGDPPPKGVIEERDVKGFIISRLRFWEREGVVTKTSLDAAIEDGTLIVKINATDSTQVDIVMPFSIVQPLAKMGVVAQRVPN